METILEEARKKVAEIMIWLLVCYFGSTESIKICSNELQSTMLPKIWNDMRLKKTTKARVNKASEWATCERDSKKFALFRRSAEVKHFSHTFQHVFNFTLSELSALWSKSMILHTEKLSHKRVGLNNLPTSVDWT